MFGIFSLLAQGTALIFTALAATSLIAESSALTGWTAPFIDLAVVNRFDVALVLLLVAVFFAAAGVAMFWTDRKLHTI